MARTNPSDSKPIIRTTPTQKELDTLKQLEDIAATYSCMSQFNEMLSFFRNTDNAIATQMAVENYGLPPKNSENTHSFWGGWTDPCEWDRGMYKVFIAARTYKQLNLPDLTNKKNCSKIESYKVTFEEEKKNAYDLMVVSGDKVGAEYALVALNDLSRKINSAYSNLDCEQYLYDEEINAAADIIEKQGNNAADGTTGKDSNNGGTSTQIGIYVVYGVLALIAGVVVKKIFFK